MGVPLENSSFILEVSANCPHSFVDCNKIKLMSCGNFAFLCMWESINLV